MTGCVQSEKRDSRILAGRVLLLAAVLGVEAVVASEFLDGQTLFRKQGLLTGLIRDWGAWSVRFAIGFAALFATFAWLKQKPALLIISTRAGETPVARAAIAAHLLAVPLFAVLSAALYGAGFAAIPTDIIAAAWIYVGASVVITAAFAFFPYSLWAELRRATGNLWLYAAGASAAACILGVYSRFLWPPTTRLTFHLVKLLLQPFFHDIVMQPAVMRLGTNRFTAVVSPECSGLEGAALLVIFGVFWLLLFWEESRFPQALLLLPAATLTLFLLNSLRIAALIVIGHAGFREIATKGFHSQAGWIAFNFVAFGFSAAARRLPWFSKRGAELSAAARATYNPATAYLVPFLTILAARMISRSISGNFEWFYALGFFLSLISLWALRSRYSDISWKFGWPAVFGGILVFALWAALERFSNAPAAGMPPALASAPATQRNLWIALRVLSAVVTVPIAEELAFRGFLQRRLVAAHFETVSFRTWTWFSVGASSVMFGAMHGERWLAGAVAGAIYAALAIRTGRLGEAVAAHSITNAILAAVVLFMQKWQFW